MTLERAKRKLLREIQEARIELARLRALPPPRTAWEVVCEAFVNTMRPTPEEMEEANLTTACQKIDSHP